jgi:hypothetical protein
MIFRNWGFTSDAILRTAARASSAVAATGTSRMASQLRRQGSTEVGATAPRVRPHPAPCAHDPLPLREVVHAPYPDPKESHAVATEIGSPQE